MKVLIYSSEEIYKTATFEGRAEADIIAYRVEDHYTIVKDRHKIAVSSIPSSISCMLLKRQIELRERLSITS
jgi:hypothetical protein